MHQNAFGGPLGSLQRSPDLLAGFNSGRSSKGRRTVEKTGVDRQLKEGDRGRDEV